MAAIYYDLTPALPRAGQGMNHSFPVAAIRPRPLANPPPPG